ncbi:hypothetical protein Hanom_Chr08g00755091 [Helianthus anomalus]
MNARLFNALKVRLGSNRPRVSITLIATGFKRQEESDGRTLQGGQADAVGMNRRAPAFTEGGSVEIPEFLRKKGRSRYPRA